jgi:hypothetical protein
MELSGNRAEAGLPLRPVLFLACRLPRLPCRAIGQRPAAAVLVCKQLKDELFVRMLDEFERVGKLAAKVRGVAGRG